MHVFWLNNIVKHKPRNCKSAIFEQQPLGRFQNFLGHIRPCLVDGHSAHRVLRVLVYICRSQSAIFSQTAISTQLWGCNSTNFKPMSIIVVPLHASTIGLSNTISPKNLSTLVPELWPQHPLNNADTMMSQLLRP